MQLIVSSVLPYLMCLAMIAITSTFWWSKLLSPWSFVLFGFLTLLGTHRVYLIATETWNILSLSGQFLEYQGPVTPESIARIQAALLSKAITASIVILVTGSPLLVWLKGLMVKA
jgi:hypothetical protein